MIETQALVSTAVYGTPQRSATGFDIRRMNMLLAVLEKRAGFKLAQKDVFLNIAGGLRVNDPAIDLAVLSAILSSSLDISRQSNRTTNNGSRKIGILTDYHSVQQPERIQHIPEKPHRNCTSP